MAKVEQRLKTGALSAIGVAAIGSVMMAPALGIYANLPLISAEAGKAGPAVFLVALLLTLPVAMSYALIAREIPSAGGAYKWLSVAASPVIGTWVGLLLLATYLFCVVLQPVLFGLFFNELLASFSIPTGYGTWLLGVLLSTGLVAALAYPGIEFSARGSVILTIVEAVVVLALSVTVLASLFSNGQVSWAPFNPMTSLHGRAGFFHGLVFALLSFVGFGVIATAAEETHAPRTVIPRAMVLACAILGLFWAATSLSFCLVLPPEEWSADLAKNANPIAAIARRSWGGGSLLVILTALSAVLGVYLASVVGYARVTYAVARDGLLFGALAKLHPKRQVPWNAQHLVFIVAPLGAALWGKWLDPYSAYDWWGSVVVFFSMVSNVFVSAASALFFYRFRRTELSWFWHGAIPIAGVGASLLPLYYCFGPDLWHAGWKKGVSIVAFCAFILAISTVYTAYLRIRKPALMLRDELEEVYK
ncbi:MAG: APC family permease [Bryobacteraceae bacterium]